MSNRDDFEFILLPWEHRGANFDPRPDVIVEWEWEGTAYVFLLKSKRNLLFFREAHRNNEFLCVLDNPLFSDSLSEGAVREWMQTNAAFVVCFWQEEVKGGRYARFVTGEHPLLEGTFLLLFKQDGQGWVREPWDEKGIPFRWKSEMVWPTPFFEWIVEAFPNSFEVFSANEQLQKQIEEREMPAQAIKQQPLEWICGSQEELKQLTRWIAFTESQKWSDGNQRTFVFSCENDEGCAELKGVIENGYWAAPSSRLKALTNLALDFNTPVGIQWEFCDGSSGDPPIRGSWTPEGPEIHFVIDQPSHHERLEARLLLRDWLLSKVPDANLDEWFSLPTDCE